MCWQRKILEFFVVLFYVLPPSSENAKTNQQSKWQEAKLFLNAKRSRKKAQVLQDNIGMPKYKINVAFLFIYEFFLTSLY